MDPRTAQGLIEEHPSHFKDELVFFTSAYLQPRRNLTNQKTRKFEISRRKSEANGIESPQGVKRKSSPGPIGSAGSPKRLTPNWVSESDFNAKLAQQNAEFEKVRSPEPNFGRFSQPSSPGSGKSLNSSVFEELHPECEKIQIFQFGSMQLRVPITTQLDRSSMIGADFCDFNRSRCATYRDSFAASSGQFSCAY